MDAAFSQETCDEMRTWLQHFHAELEKNPARELFACFNRDLTIQVVNQASQFIQRAFDWRPEDSGQSIDEAQFRKAKCSLYLYYRVLQGVLVEGPQSADPEAAQLLVDNEHFVESLLLVAIELPPDFSINQVTHAWHGGKDVFPAATLRLERLYLAFDMWEATALFRQHLGTGSTPASDGEQAAAQAPSTLPAAALQYLGFMRVRITEELAFLNGSTLFTAMQTGGGGSRPPGNFALVSDFIATAATLARERTFQVCTELAGTVPAVARIAGFEAEVQALLTHTQVSHYEVLNNQHQLNVIGCCIHAVSRVHGVPLPFRRINEAIATVFPLQPPELFTEADIGTTAGVMQQGNTRELYNSVFLPAMEEHLQELIAQREKAASAAPPAAKLYKSPQPPTGAAAAVSRGQRQPFAALSASDRNVRRNSSVL